MKDSLVDDFNFDKDIKLLVDRDAGITKSARLFRMSILENHKTLPITVNQFNIYVDEIDLIPELKCYPNTNPNQGPQGKKGIMDGERFDSMWEGAVYAYYRYIKGFPIERNYHEWVPYFDENGKKRKFYPDFKFLGTFLEVKGIYRGNDLCKINQHPEIEFIDKTKIQPILKELNKTLPNWKKDYIITS